MPDVPPDAVVAPIVGLALLESVRAADTSAEDGLALADLPALPQRLGLSSAVEEQIERWGKRGRREPLPLEEVASLFELIGRRPDARRVFADAGRRLASRQLGEGGLGSRLRSAALPEAARHRLALRQARRLAREVSPGSDVRTEKSPPALIVESCLPARSAGIVGCSLFLGAVEAILDAYSADDVEVKHAECEGRAERRCVWRIERPG